MSARRYGKVWVEIMTTDRFTEALVELPANWDTLTPDEQDKYLLECWNDLRDNLANGGYEVVEES